MREISFNQGFALNRERLAGMIRCIQEDRDASTATIAAYIGVNPYMIQGLSGWLRKTGLIQASTNGYVFTPLGEIIAQYDSGLEDTATLWLLHYNLCSVASGERSEVWYRCFNEFLTSNKIFKNEELRAYIERIYQGNVTNKEGIAKDSKELTKTYTQPSALGKLGILNKSSKLDYSVQQPLVSETSIIAFVLFDSWERCFGSTDTIRLSQIVSEPESIGRIFVADYEQVRNYILALQNIGLVNYSDTQHEPVTRRFNEPPISLLERYYNQL